MQQQTYQMPNWGQMMSGWGALGGAARCPVCGGGYVPPPAAAAPAAGWLGQWNEIPFVREWNRVWGGMLDPLMRGMTPAAAGQQQLRHEHRHQHAKGRHDQHEHHGRHDQHEHRCGCTECCGCSCRGCSCCRADDCRCRCCVVDADLLVYARAGETRVVPVTIENNTRREREVDLDLSEWTGGGGQPARVVGKVEPEGKFTMRACEERTVTILVRVGAGDGQPGSKNVTEADKKVNADAAQSADAAQPQHENAARAVVDDRTRERLPDVDTCAVFYADLRVNGCDVRPVRIALAVLPRDCDAYKVDCQCGCCC